MTTTLELPGLGEASTRARPGVLVEAKLQDWNLSYEYVAEFPLEKIRIVDWTQVRSATEHAGADKESLAEFRIQMTKGAVYPPVIVMEPTSCSTTATTG